MGPRKPAPVCIPVVSHVLPSQSDHGAPKTQLQFSENAPALPENLAAQFTNPHPIVIEKLKSLEGRQDEGPGDGPRSSVPFAIISEEKLNQAVHLARRDVKRRHLEEQVRQQLAKGERCPATIRPSKGSRSVSEFRASKLNLNHERRAPEKVEAAASGAKVFVCTPPRGKLHHFLSDSPPTRDPGPGPTPALKRKQDRSAREVRQLQRELQNYVRKIEELARRERREDVLEPEEERRVQVWRQEQSARSARMLYVLRQQVKEIQDDLEKLSPCRVKHTKKSQAMARLAAAHRGAIRALQMFVGRSATQSRQQLVPAHCKELGNLIRQLSLCSARLEMDSTIPDVIIELLLQIEDLESLLSMKETPPQKQKAPSTSQATSLGDGSRWPRREKQPGASESPKPLAARRLLPETPRQLLPVETHSLRSAPCDDRIQEGQPPPKQSTGQAPEKARPSRVPAGLGSAAAQKKGVSFSSYPQENARLPRTKASQAQPKQGRFREPTIAFRLKETKAAVREGRSTRVLPHPASPQRHLERSPKGGEPPREGKQETPEKEALSAGNENVFATRIAERVERAIQECLEPLLAKAQELNLSLGQNVLPKEASRGDKLSAHNTQKAAAAAGVPVCDLKVSGLQQHKETEPEVPSALSASDLETMLQRMEEMERYQEAVCQRYHSIMYADPDFWAREQGNAAGERVLGPPHPIQITKPEGRSEPQAEIVFKRPLDTNAVDEVAEREVSPEPRAGNGQPSAASLPLLRREAGTFLSVPKKMLQSISDYGARYEQHLKRISHEAVGSFNPWRIAQSLAEELMEEALVDVAAELQDLCEDCAEAVFTSEFLQAAEAPLGSPGPTELG